MKQIDFKKHQNSKAVMHLHGGEEVVGTEVDENNRLIYIIKREGQLVASYAEDERPIIETNQGPPSVVKVPAT